MKTISAPTAVSASLSRRRFIGTGIAAAAALTTSRAAHTGISDAIPNARLFAEAAQNIPLNDDADVIVCGGGPAGVTAAIAAARSGARVRLFEIHGCLGGVWTGGLLGYLMDFDKPGFNRELVRKLDERDARRGTAKTNINYEPEEMKMLLEDLCVEAGVKFQLHTRVAAAHREGNRLTTIVTESKSGRQAWRAKVFIDATGDGDLGAQAGCEWEIGEAADCPCQPMSMDALLIVKDATLLPQFLHRAGAQLREVPDHRLNFRDEIRRAGLEPSYGMPTLFQVRDNLLLVMMNHEYGVKPYDAAQVTDATVRARSEIHRIVRALRKLGGVWDGVQIAATPEQIGIRDGRRIRGRYIVSKSDISEGKRHDDGVMSTKASVDIHATSFENNKTSPFHASGVKTQLYDIPLRALIARDVDGLMMAGRCISGDFFAHASYRLTGNAVAMGESAGAVAAIAAQTRRLPHDVSWGEGVATLKKIGIRS